MTLLVAVFAAGTSENQAAGKAASSGANWLMFRGNPALTGVAAGTLPDKLSLLWSFKTGGPVKSSAAIVGGRVFIGSGDSSVYALDLASGKKTWAARTGGPVDSSPLVLDGKVFFGSTDASLYAVEAASGRQLWKYETGDKILGAPNWFVQPLTRPSDTLSPSDGERDGVRGSRSARSARIVAGRALSRPVFSCLFCSGPPQVFQVFFPLVLSLLHGGFRLSLSPARFHQGANTRGAL